MIKEVSLSKFIFRFVMPLVVAATVLSPTKTQATVNNFACPVGGGTYQVNSGTLTGTLGTCSGDLVLDSSVTAINYLSLSSASITSLTIPASVIEITNPFYYNRDLVSISVSGGTTFKAVNGVLFNFAETSLIVYPASKSDTSYTIPITVSHIGIYAFHSSKYLTSITISNGVTSTDGGFLTNAQALTTVNIGTGLTDLGEQSFSYIPTLTSINVDALNSSFASMDGVLYSKDISTLWAYPIGKTATSYTAPNTVTATKYTVFGGASNLLTVDLTSVATLSGQEFMDATSVREIKFGNSLTRLNTQTLQSASGLEKLYLGTGLTTIVDGAFSGNTALTSVYFLGDAPTVQPNEFLTVAAGAKAYIETGATGFGSAGDNWNGLVVEVNVSAVSAPVPIVANGYRADKLATVYFSPLSSKLSKVAKKQLEAAVIANPSAVYKISGYVQKSIFAKNAKNDASLSLARAKAIETHLLSLGAGVTFTVVIDGAGVPAKNSASNKSRRATLYAMTPVVQ